MSYCPPGKVVVGGGGFTSRLGSPSRPGAFPRRRRGVVGGRPRGHADRDTWQVSGYAICVTALP